MTPRLELSDITLRVGARTPLRGMNSRVVAGEVHAPNGANGAEKSALAYAVEKAVIRNILGMLGRRVRP